MGRYRLLELIGRGGFVEVYFARDVETSAVVAVKVLHARVSDHPALVERFVREARRASQLNDPCVVPVFDAGSEVGLYFLGLEHVEGHRLDRLVAQRGALDPGEVAGIGTRVLRALEVAHAHGVVHRDIKPSNTMLMPDGLVRVMDLGIAKEIGAESVIVSGKLIGTSAYAAPEQARGLGVDGRSARRDVVRTASGALAV
jgi:serine/threonine-protein kinase